MKTYEFMFLDVEEAVEHVAYDLSTSQIADVLATGLVLVSVKEKEAKVYCYVVDDGVDFCANGYVCAVSMEDAKELVVEEYHSESIKYAEVFEDDVLTQGVWVGIREVYECSSSNC